MNYFLERYTRSKNKIKVRLNFSSYAKKSDLKNAAGVDASKFAKKSNLESQKSDSDKLNIDEFKKYQVI